jgi:molybdopterin-binding protein
LGSVVRLKVGVGNLFIVQITKRSFNDMRFNLNTEVLLAFLASNVQIMSSIQAADFVHEN